MRSARVAALFLSIIFATSGGAAAQGREPSVFVSGGAFVGVERANQGSLAGLVTPELSGIVPGGLAGIGTQLNSRVNICFELAFAGTVDDEVVDTFSSSFPPVQVTRRRRAEERVQTGSVLLGYRANPSGRFGVECLGGIAFVRARRQSSQFVSEIPSIPGLGDEESTSTFI